MRPLFLRIRNIGPFKNQDIDFSSLSDMFLVCGKTGAGKSTIFNAITYALYGRLTGSHSQVKGPQIRSDFAPPDEDATITLVFILHDKCYKVKRELQRVYTNRNGNTSTKAEEVQLYRKEGEDWLLLKNKKSEADELLASLMGLTVDEFSRIIMLPQGEFAEFLRQNSNQRRETLLKLFPLDHYERLIQTAKERSDRDSALLSSILTQIQSFGDFDLQQQEEILAQYRQVLQDNQKTRENLTASHTSTQMAIDECRRQLNDFQTHREATAKLELHTSREDTVQRQRQQIRLAERAAPAYTRIEAWRRCQKDRQEAQSQLESTAMTLQQLEQEQQQLKQQEPTIQQLQESHGKNLLLQQELDRAVETERELLRLAKSKEAAAGKSTRLQHQLENLAAGKASLEEELSQLQEVSIQSLEPLLQQQQQLATWEQECKENLSKAREWLSLQEKITTQQQVVENARQESQSIQQEFLSQQQELESLREQNQARLLAAKLRPGKPCPVCGSTSHHQPEAPVQPHQQAPLEQLQESLRQLEERRNQAQQKSSREEGFLEQMLQQQSSLSAQSPCQPLSQLENLQKEIQRQNIQLESEIATLRQSISRKEEVIKKLEDCRHQQEPLQQQHSSLQQELAILTGQASEKEASLQQAMERAKAADFHYPSATETRQALKNWLENAHSSINQFHQQLDSLRQRHSQETARLQERTHQLNRCQQLQQEAERQMEEGIREAGFATIEEVEAAHLSQEEIHGLRSSVEAWQQELTRIKTQVEEIGRRLKGTRSEAEERLTQLQDKSREIQTRLSELEDKYQEAFHQQEETRTRIGRWKELEELRQAAQRTASLSRQLYTHISDSNEKKLAITTWILGIYLDQIVACANGRLQRISEGRYTLRFIQEKGGNGVKGLDLEILDSYTGKRRPCATLSGGETFMVSLSLALALTDVVSSRRGGISLQSLFIDEGFGSLDPSALDKAMSILEEVREGRMVGVISHVTEMQGRIPIRLEVIKTPTGSSVRIVEG